MVNAVELRLYRHSGHIGQWVPLDVLVDDQPVGKVRVSERFSATVPDDTAEVSVSMQGSVGSRCFRVPAGLASIELECGNPWWMAIDPLSLCYLPMLRNRAFYLRQAPCA